jgi:hypothetical protein
MTSRGSSAVAHVAEAAGRYAHQVSDQVRKGCDRAEGVVRHDPARSVAVVFGIGLVAGLIVGLAVRRRCVVADLRDKIGMSCDNSGMAEGTDDVGGHGRLRNPFHRRRPCSERFSWWS